MYFLLLILMYFSPCRGAASDSSFTNSAILDANGNYELFWKFDSDVITFEVQVKTSGWIGLGISPNGGMAGSDMVIGWMDSAGSSHFADRHATGETTPVMDVSQDWTFINGSATNSMTTMQFSRNILSCEPDDLSITESTARVVWAYCDVDPTSDTNIPIHTNMGAKSLMLLSPVVASPNIPEYAFKWNILMNNVAIPNDKTSYICRTVPISSTVGNTKHHVIQIENIIQPGNENLVHHIVVYACYETLASADLDRTETCRTHDPWKNCTAGLYAWAIGGGTFNLPNHVGLPFGETDSPKAIMLEIHYDNPTQTLHTDSSGLSFTMTEMLRTHDAGIIEAGLFVTFLQLIPPQSPAFNNYGFCRKECLRQAMSHSNVPEIKVIGCMLHAHVAARSIVLRHFRDGTELPPIFSDKKYDFDYQEYRLRNDEVIVKSGDNLITQCTYNTEGKDTITWGGTATYQEMCMAFMMYYPKIALSNCESSPVPEIYLDSVNIQYYPNNQSWVNDILSTTWTAELKTRFQAAVLNPSKLVLERCEQGQVFQSENNYKLVLPDPMTTIYTTDDQCRSGQSPLAPVRTSIVIIAGIALTAVMLR